MRAIRSSGNSCPLACGPARPRRAFFGDLDNPKSHVNKLIAEKKGVRLKDETGNKPQVYYVGSGAAVPAGRAQRES